MAGNDGETLDPVCGPGMDEHCPKPAVLTLGKAHDSRALCPPWEIDLQFKLIGGMYAVFGYTLGKDVGNSEGCLWRKSQLQHLAVVI